MVAHKISLQQIENREQKDPDQIDEVPEQAGDFDAVGVLLWRLLPPATAGEEEIRHDDRATNDVRGMQAGEREVNREVGAALRRVGGEIHEVARLDGELLVIMLRIGCRALLLLTLVQRV